MFKSLFKVLKVVYHITLGGKDVKVHIGGKDVNIHLPETADEITDSVKKKDN